MYRITLFPAEDGDCILVETGSTDCPHRLLIDGGRKRTYKKHLAKLFSKPFDDRPVVDLLVLTHVDADHIGGLLELIKLSSASLVGEVWFNGGEQIRAARFGPAKNQNASSGKTLSAEQAVWFERGLRNGKWKWNTWFKGGPVMTEDGVDLPCVSLTEDTVLTILGPPKAKLAAFDDSWEAAVANLQKRAAKAMAGRAFPHLTVDGLAALAATEDDPDTAKANGTSIAFVVSAEKKNCLFCADAHPDDIVNALNRFAPGENRVAFSAIKASHHGSAANNTNALIERLHSPKWLISTNGAVHQHPDPEAISRMVLAEPKGKQLIFNHKGEQTRPWEAQDLQDSLGFTTFFPSENGLPVSIDLA